MGLRAIGPKDYLSLVVNEYEELQVNTKIVIGQGEGGLVGG
jgi:hypothetical protein